MKNRNTSKIIQKCIFLIFLITYNICAIAQFDTDSLKKDSINTPRIELNSKDKHSGFIPLDSIRQDDLQIINTENKKIPGRAGLLSAIIPGMGQAYNGNYWKIPIIYSLFAGIYFIGEDNHFKYLKFRQAYLLYDEGWKIPGINPLYSKAELKDIKDFYKRNRDLNIIIGFVVYFMNILDASVDAHLMNYDISDDLSLKIEPDVNFYQAYENNSRNSGFGIKFVLSLHK